MSTDRILLHYSIAGTFIEELKKALRESSTDEAPTLVTAASKARVEAMIASALDSGAHVVHGAFEKPTVPPETLPSVRMGPLVLGGVNDDMRIWKEEAFASLAICRVVESEEEAVKIANTGGYGLSAAVFTEDLRKGLAMAKKIESGYVLEFSFFFFFFFFFFPPSC